MNISNQAPQNKQASNLDLIINTPGTTQAQTNSLDFNTMQNFFATQNQTGNPSLNFNNPNTSINPNSNISPATDFNTMQQMFATIAQNNNTQNIVPPSNYQAGDASNFYSMYNLFATSNNQGVTLSTPQQAPSLVNNTAPQTSANNFPTIHNLFATSSHMPTSQMGNTNLGNINNQDFSTMQNLFKTSGTAIAFPPPSVSVV
jgi:hypothetical protein